ncbi:hypothetical protein KVR01_006335 [Diaporthe batatas]|uniref:uncharacterized protein n=1 Tax=Diaporthe batatas TaxID=748121 RepID=UPI001D05459C|nr:uncharacterized protein KVR01_006335 [Diaporthe batatas]KAG8164417.1 hypothetical protein KVR01_006335 [Diaporthe batatas]
MESTGSTATAHAQNSGHKVRRPRAARACNLCRLKKNKCDELYPCTYCRNRNVECVYQGQDSSRRRYTPEYVRGLEQQVEQLSAQLEAQAAGSSSSVKSGFSAPGQYATNHAAPPSGSPGTSVALSATPPTTTTTTTTTNITTRARQRSGQEVTAVNSHTRNVEFYGSSSSVALLSQVQRGGGRSPASSEAGASGAGEHSESDAAAAALLSNLHNPAFSPPTLDAQDQGVAAGGGAGAGRGADEGTTVLSVEEAHLSAMEPAYYRQCSVFLHNFFSTMHYIHPMVDKTSFLERCEILWSGDKEAMRQHASFVPLYFSIMSIGALVGYRDIEPVGGVSNQKWSRRFFNEARARFKDLELATDLEMVQTFFFMAKVCQNELNAHWSYFYIGMAVRTALAVGINREPGSNCKKSPAQLRAEARTWWGIYSLEEELSFAMGRPSGLGAEEYHNRAFPLTEFTPGFDPGSPLLDPPHCAIIEHMVHFSRLIRQVCIDIYLPQNSAARTVELAQHLDQRFDSWVAHLPEPIRPRLESGQSIKIGSHKEAMWMKRQKLVLNMRYLNLRILLFGSILLTSTPAERSSVPGSHECVQKCLDSAKRTIEIIHETYHHQEFFRTWFYNTTYTIFATSIILVYINQEASEAEMDPLVRLVHMAIEVLETMADECVVAGKSAKLLQKAMEKSATTRHEKSSERLAATLMSTNGGGEVPALENMGSGAGVNGPATAAAVPAPEDGFTDPMAAMQWRHCWAPVNLLDSDVMDFDFGIPFIDFDERAIPGTEHPV